MRRVISAVPSCGCLMCKRANGRVASIPSAWNRIKVMYTGFGELIPAVGAILRQLDQRS